MKERAPAYQDPVLHFDALRLVAKREGDRTEENIATENERGVLIYAPAHVHSAHAALCCWSKPAAHTKPVMRTCLMAPAWRTALCIWGVVLDLTQEQREMQERAARAAIQVGAAAQPLPAGALQAREADGTSWGATGGIFVWDT